MMFINNGKRKWIAKLDLHLTENLINRWCENKLTKSLE